MAKKTKTKAASEPKAATEERSSFLPDDEKTLQEPIAVEAENTMASGSVRLEISRPENRFVEVSLTIEPLPTITRQMFVPLKASGEQLAGRIAAALKDAAHSAITTAEVQHYNREQEDKEARERLAARG